MNIESKGSHYIYGQWFHSKGDPLLSINPSNQETCWIGEHATLKEVEYAVGSAQEALSTWKKTSLDERTHYLLQFMHCVEQRKQELIEVISQETGKPFWESTTEVQAVLSKIELSIQAYREKSDGLKQGLRYKPLGLFIVLGAYNFPAHLSNGHIVPALLSGNTVIYKPSELTPLVAKLITECWEATKLPKGVFNLLQGGKETAQALLNQSSIAAVAFTGSYQTGVSISKQLAARPEVLLALEMGGNNPLIIDQSVDLDAAIYTTLLSAYITAGQRCSCARRLMIPNTSFGDHFIEKLQIALKKLKIGTPHDQPEPFMGPVIRHEQALRHLAWVEEWIRRGAVSLSPMELMNKKGNFLTPGLLDMSTISLPPDIEIFAPLLQIYRYQTLEQALQLANHTQYGLTAGLLSEQPEHYAYFYDHIKAGIICWNRPTTGSPSSLPFGGLGHSGNHRPSGYFAIDYCQDPITLLEEKTLSIPKTTPPGLNL